MVRWTTSIRSVIIGATAVGAVLLLSSFAYASSGESEAVREHRVGPGDVTTSWGYYGVTPECPDGERLVYAVFRGNIVSPRAERPSHPGELWVSDIDGENQRKVFEGQNTVHNGFGQSWVDNERIVFRSEGAAYVLNVDTKEVEFGPFDGLIPAHYAMEGKVLLSRSRHGFYELDIATGDKRKMESYDGTITHLQYAPDMRRALFTTEGNYHLAKLHFESAEIDVFPDWKPMHFQWFDNNSLFGSIAKPEDMLGVDPQEHHLTEVYRWNLEGEIIEHLAGEGCHPAVRADGAYVAGETYYPWEKYDSHWTDHMDKEVSLWLYARGRREPIKTIYTHDFPHIVWETRAHVNPSFSRDGKRLYYNKAVSEDASQTFYYDLTGLVGPMEEEETE